MCACVQLCVLWCVCMYASVLCTWTCINQMSLLNAFLSCSLLYFFTINGSGEVHTMTCVSRSTGTTFKNWVVLFPRCRTQVYTFIYCRCIYCTILPVLHLTFWDRLSHFNLEHCSWLGWLASKFPRAISLDHMSELFKSLLCWNILSARYAVWHVFVFPYHGCLKLGIGSQAQGEAVMSTALRAWLWPHCSGFWVTIVNVWLS